MPEYKKKNIKKKKRVVKNAYNDDIKMSPSKRDRREKSKKTDAPKKEQPVVKENNNKSDIKVIRGGRLKNIRRRRIIIGCCIVLIAVIVVFSIKLPTGIFEFLQNKMAAIGSGSGYPVTISGGMVIDCKNIDNVFITVTPTAVSGYNTKSGKNVFSYQHGYENPALSVSEARFMLYAQGGDEYCVYNLKKQLISQKTQNDILTASIGRDGTYAVATQSDGYSSEVTVFDKNGKKVYKWFCADYIINDLIVADNGKHLVVSAVNGKEGKFISKIYMLDFNTATPLYSTTFDNDIILDINSENNKTFYAIFENKIEFFSWKDYAAGNYKCEKEIIFNRSTAKYNLLVTNQETNKNYNTIYVFDKKNQKHAQFNFELPIIDIEIKGRYVYILSDKHIYLYSCTGEKISDTSCDFGVVKIIPINKNNVAVLTDNYGKKVSLN